VPPRAEVVDQAVVGRDQALATIRAVLSSGRSAASTWTMLIFGEAGVGKTALARHATRAGHARLLYGACPRLRSLTVPLLPPRTALRESSAPASDACRTEMEVPDRAPLALDRWLDEVTGEICGDPPRWKDTADHLHRSAVHPISATAWPELLSLLRLMTSVLGSPKTAKSGPSCNARDIFRHC
jgi:hypothetical protein